VEARSPEIAKAEKGLAEMQQALDHAKTMVDAADRADQGAREAVGRARSTGKTLLLVAGVLLLVAVLGAVMRRRR
jgi:hypothetical protein